MSKFDFGPFQCDMARRSLSANSGMQRNLCSAAVHSVSQHIEFFNEFSKMDRMLDFCHSLKPLDKAVVFVRNKACADNISSNLVLAGFTCMSIHLGCDPCDHQQALKDLMTGDLRLLITTDNAWLEKEEFTHVVNYDFPLKIEEYVHRLQQAGRARKKVQVLSLLNHCNWSSAKLLIETLEATSQEVPQELREMADRFKDWRERKSGGKGGNGDRCFNCKQYGHMSRECLEPRHRPVGGAGGISCYNCDQPGHKYRECPELQRGREGRASRISCYNCNQPGHMFFECQQPRRGLDGWGSGRNCYNCNQPGHTFSECPEPRRGLYGWGSGISCYNCNRRGHMFFECSEPSRGIDGWGSGRNCYNCNRLGHMFSECPEPRSGLGGGGGGRSRYNFHQ